MKAKLKGEEILIIKNISREGPGIFEEIIIESGIKYKVIDLSQSPDIPALDNYGAVIVLGGPDSANDGNPKIKHELALIGKVLNANIPYLGICLGMQVAAIEFARNVCGIKTANSEEVNEKCKDAVIHFIKEQKKNIHE